MKLFRRISAIFLVLLLLAGCGMEGDASVSAEVPSAASAPSDAPESGLTVWFLDIGQGDSTLLYSGGEYLLIDGGLPEMSDRLVTLLQSLGVEQLKAVVCTHAHADHVGGLSAALAVFPTGAVYAPTADYASASYDDFLYYVNQQGLTVTIPTPGDTLTLGDAVLTVLGPVKDYPDVNNTSLVLRADCGGKSFLFTGDMEQEAEYDLLDAGAPLKADVLKVGHHGSNSSTSYRFLQAVAPEYAALSCAVGNDYGHPHAEPLARLQDAGVTLFRTDTLGTIRCDLEGQTLSFSWEKQSADPMYADYAARDGEHYIGNRNSLTLHAPTCEKLPSERNREEFTDYEEAIAAGYTPHYACLGAA